MEHPELVLLGMVGAAVALLLLADRLKLPYPVLLVLGGLGLGFMPWLETPELAPELVLVIFLPPLLYSAALYNSPRDLLRNAGPISLLSLGLVLLTVGGVAVAAHALVGLSWPTAFVLGAVVSPTDAAAAIFIAQRLPIPRRVLVIIEGENLVNDGPALVSYQLAVAAVSTGVFVAWRAGLGFVLTVTGGAAVGLAVGWMIGLIRRRLDNPQVEITLSLATGYLAYIPAEEAGVSGVIAAVTAGLYLGWQAPRLVGPVTRLQTVSVWQSIQFLLNAALFILVGSQLPGILDDLGDERVTTLALDALLISLVVIVLRVAWVFALTYGPRALFHHMRERDVTPWQNLLLLSWTGMRGGVSLAAALAIPIATTAGTAFPDRDRIIFLTFGVILVTLLVQSLTLPPMLRRLRVAFDDDDDREEVAARVEAANAAIARLDQLAGEDWVREDTAERVRALYRFRAGRFEARQRGDGAVEARSADYQRLMRELISAQRAVLLRLRNERRISDEVMRRVERELDLEEVRLE
jgi:Na+/H+ antiporter